jgi:hypothetical protein
VPLSIEFALENFYRAETNSKVKRVQVPVFYLQVTPEALGSGYLDFQPYVYYAGSTPSLESAPGVSEFDIGKMDGAVTILILSSQRSLRNDPEMESLIQTRSIIPLYIDLNQIKSGGEGLALDLISSDWTGGNSTLHSFRLAFGDVTQLEDPNDTYKYQNVGSLEALESLLDQQN